MKFVMLPVIFGKVLLLLSTASAQPVAQSVDTERDGSDVAEGDVEQARANAVE